MPKIELERAHTLPKEELDAKAEVFIKKMTEKLASMNMAYKWRPAKDGIDFDGKGFKGKVDLTPDKIKIFVDLSLMLAPFKGAVEEQMNRGLDKLLAK